MANLPPNRFEKKNPGAGRTATGAESFQDAVERRGKDSATKRANAISKFGKAEHKAAARSLGYALTSGDADAWSDFTRIIDRRLTTQERAALAWASLRSLSPDIAEITVEAVLGAPLPTYFAGQEIDAARHWAHWATARQREAFALAAYDAMPADRQAAFLSHVQGRGAA
ncbi:hypothetical protein [Fluviibacterium sp. S390]|uniref:hypothetical protein n=1 Tax=Fluviibacterium sp. S390 TaxID=3415139 RepID=UPI003C79F4CD